MRRFAPKNKGGVQEMISWADLGRNARPKINPVRGPDMTNHQY